jgi:hypothetical protein
MNNSFTMRSINILTKYQNQRYQNPSIAKTPILASNISKTIDNRMTEK